MPGKTVSSPPEPAAGSPFLLRETQFQPAMDDSQNLWEAEEILDERGPPKYGEYLVRWKGSDRDSGEIWDPSWESKTGCTEGLIADWKALKKVDPGVVGRAGKEWERKWEERRREAQKCEAERRRAERQERKRKRERERAGTEERENKKGKPTTITSVSDVFVVGEGSATSRKASVITRHRGETVSSIASSNAAHSDFAPSTSDLHVRRSTRRGPASTFTTASLHADRPRTRMASRGHHASDSVEPHQPSEIVLAGSPDGKKEAGSLVSNGSKNRRSMPFVELPTRKPLSPIQSASTRQPLTGTATSPLDMDSIDASRATVPLSENGIIDNSPPRNSAAQRSREFINISDSSSRAGPGPTTMQNRQMAKRSKPFNAGKKGVGPIPQPSPEVFRLHVNNTLDASGTQTDSTGTSLADPIAEFSSPPRPSSGQNGSKRRTREVPSDIQQMAQKPHSVDEESDRPRVVRRIIDGEETFVVLTESMERDEAEMGLHVATEGEETPVDASRFAGQAAESLHEGQGLHRNETRVSHEDLALLDGDEKQPRLDDVEENTDVANQNVCRWASCNHHFEAALDLARHLLEHAQAIHPHLHSSAAPDLDAPSEISYGVVGTSKADTSMRTKRDDEIADLKSRLEYAEDRNKSLLSDTDFLRRQYSKASERATSEAQRVVALEKEMEILRGQLKFGLRQRVLHNEAIKAQRDAEMVKLRAQVKILLDQSHLTDDAVRAKAVQYPENKARLKTAERELREAREKLDRALARNEELRDQVEVLRARQMGILEEDDDEKGNGETNTEGSSVAGGREDPAEMEIAMGRAHVTSSGNVHGPAKEAVDGAMDAMMAGGNSVFIVSEGAVITKEDVALMNCRANALGQDNCMMSFETPEDFLKHVEEKHVLGVPDIGDRP